MKITGEDVKILSRIDKQIHVAVMVLAIISATLLSGCGKPGAGVVIAGSTSVQPYAEILAEEFALLYPDSEIDIQGGGSAAGITAAESGTADIGMSSRSLKDKELERGLWWIEIARDGLAVIVHPQNKVNDLTFDQICDIYAGKVLNWSEVGGRDAKIHLIAREEGSGTRSAFEELLMKDERITPKAIVQNSNGSVKQLVSNDQNAIGFISLGLVNDQIKALALNGVEATHDNIVNGTYELYRPFVFVAKSEPTGPAKKFVDFILSDEGQTIMAKKGLIPATEGIQP